MAAFKLNSNDSPGAACIDYGVASQASEGETVCGDLHVVKPFDHGVLMAVIDGAGHGDQAAAAARAAAAEIERHAGEMPDTLIERCHRALVQTRGAALTVVSIRASENSLSWLGVGNVEGCLIRADSNPKARTESAMLCAGIVGYQLPSLRCGVAEVAPGDWLVITTDGIRGGFGETVNLSEPPQEIARRILAGYFRGTDDGLVLAARYNGDGK